MSIETCHAVYCDGCSKSAGMRGGTRDEARALAARMGWRYTMDEGRMIDLCSACWAKREKEGYEHQRIS